MHCLPFQSSQTKDGTFAMGKQKQQVISRFFAPKPATPPPLTASASADTLSNTNPQTPPPKISATVSFSPAKRKLLTSHLTPKAKKPKLFPHTLSPPPNPSLHQRFLNKLLEPSHEIPENSNLPSNPKKYTPLEQQVVDLKSKHPDVLLMVEVGYRYRFFGEDAQVAAKVLGIYCYRDHNFMTASIPTYRLNVHVRRLVSEGYKVGVVKQTETAAIKLHGSNRAGPFVRGLSALYTKATLEAAEDVGGGEEGCGAVSNFLMCVVEKSLLGQNIEGGIDANVGFVAVEVSTGDVIYGEFNDDFMRNGLEAAILKLSPAELLLGNPISKLTEKLLLSYAGPASNVRVEHASCDCFNDGGALAEVMGLFGKKLENDVADNTRENMEPEQGNNHPAIQGIMNMPDIAVQALALTIRHLKQFGFERIFSLGASFQPFSTEREMNLSANTIQQLEVFRNNTNGSESSSLLHIMNHTVTAYGSRLLRHWVSHPLCNRNMISARLDAVSEIAKSMGSFKASQGVEMLDGKDSEVTVIQPDFYYVLSSVLTSLGKSPDLQRGITRIFHRTAVPSEFITVLQSILNAGKQFQRLGIDLEPSNQTAQAETLQSALLKSLILAASSASVVGNATKLLSAINKEAASKQDLQNLLLISNSQFPEVAKSREAVKLIKERMDSLIALYRKQLRMSSLAFTSVSGTTHLIELPLDFKVPSNWVKVNSTKKTIRYHPPEVLTASDQLALANEELSIVCQAAWDDFLRDFGKFYSEFQAAVSALAALDCLHSLATLSKYKNYVCPTFVNDDEPVQIIISSGRHPVLETILQDNFVPNNTHSHANREYCQIVTGPNMGGLLSYAYICCYQVLETILQDNFVPNNTHLHANREYCQIVTGPNMGGKSCYIRQVALITMMAQIGSFVPASSAKLHVLDAIYTRMGASDSIQQGRSTFLEEVGEVSNILQKCTERSLVIIDELGRGTSTHDGVAIAYASLHHLLKQKRCMLLFVTHYPKIAEIEAEFAGSVGAYHVSYLTSQKNECSELTSNHKDITYLYQLVPGISHRSFGFKVAHLAQLPPTCIDRAIVMATWLEEVVSTRKKQASLLVEEAPPPSDDTKQKEEEIPESLSRMVPGKIDEEELYKTLFLNLKSAELGTDLTKVFQYIENAKTIAKQLMNRGC